MTIDVTFWVTMTEDEAYCISKGKNDNVRILCRFEHKVDKITDHSR